MKAPTIFFLLHTLFTMQSAYPDTLLLKDFSSPTSNLIVNGSFEEESSLAGMPYGWITDEWGATSTFTWDNIEAHTASKSAKIFSPVSNDAFWITKEPVQIQPNTLYSLSGWIKTDNIADTDQSAGANLGIFGTWTHTEGLTGSHDWTYKTLLFNSGPDTQLTIAARLGYWGGITTGTAWFDDLQLKPITQQNPHPNWKILVLIYGATDFTHTDSMGVQQHFVATMTEEEKEQAANNAKLFVEQDIPKLTSGNMKPKLTIRYPEQALTQLTGSSETGWSPDPEDTKADRDPAFDSVIVIWDPRAIEQNTGESKWIGAAAGLTYYMGTDQTYLAMIIESAVYYGHRNVFKHEYGHSILFYFDAAGVAPKPTVTNHAAGEYVHCSTGENYVWQDETDANQIPNSIYNNNSGFTHDYYSGTTATADQPTHCIGITPEAWSYGGPVSNSANIISSLTITNLTATPNVLWPPNGKLVPIKITVSTEDPYDPNPVCKIASVSNNQTSGKKPDWTISGDLDINLRAENSQKGNERKYTIKVACTDVTGLSTTKALIVNVPHDQRKNDGKEKKRKQIRRLYILD